MEKEIFFCSNCMQAYSGEVGTLNQCPKCGKELLVTKMPQMKWRSLQPSEKEELKIQWSQKETSMKTYLISSSGEYEYDVVTILNKDHGNVDKVYMNNILNEHASQGWKLHTVYSNELGKNAIAILGLGVNSTACEDVLIFERRVHRDNNENK